VEEISTSYVALEIWDYRRMIVPLSYFMENPFFNWTRHGTEVVARAFLYMDYTIPVEELRAEFRRIVEGSSYWNGKTCQLHVSELTDRTVEIRCSISAVDRDTGFELCCVVRENVMRWIRENYPTAFPATRFQMLPRTDAADDDSGGEPMGGRFIRST
jgi:small-conductance mechanosensitive channel